MLTAVRTTSPPCASRWIRAPLQPSRRCLASLLACAQNRTKLALVNAVMVGECLTGVRPDSSQSRSLGRSLKNRRNEHYTVTLTPGTSGARGILCFGDDGSVPPWRALSCGRKRCAHELLWGARLASGSAGATGRRPQVLSYASRVERTQAGALAHVHGKTLEERLRELAQ